MCAVNRYLFPPRRRLDHESIFAVRSRSSVLSSLLARLCAEAVPRGAEAQAAVLGAAWGGGRLAQYFDAEGNVIAAALRKPAAELTRADARSYAYSLR